MMKQYYILLFITYFLGSVLKGQNIHLLPLITKKSVSFRGLQAVNDSLIWVCGNQSTIGRSTDGGITWLWMQGLPNDSMDLRDIYAWDEYHALIVKSGWPAEIWKTKDGGASWYRVLMDDRIGMFLNAVEFWNDKLGAVLGDPLEGRFYISLTTDGGETWNELNKSLQPITQSIEYAFAASGSCIQWVDSVTLIMISGGLKSRVIYIPITIGLDIEISVDIAGIAEGKPSTGAFSIALRKNGDVLVCGGDYEKPDDLKGCLTYVHPPHHLWPVPLKSEKTIDLPGGYRSCIKLWDDNHFMITGINGTEWYEIKSMKNGKWYLKQVQHWKEGFHVLSVSPSARVGYLAGNGVIFKAVMGAE